MLIKNWKYRIHFVLVMVIMLIVAGCSQSKPAANSDVDKTVKYGGMKNLSIGASGVGSSSYNKLTIWGGYVGKKINVNITPEGSSGSAANVQLIQNDNVQIGATTPNIAREGMEGNGEFKGKKLDKLRAMIVLDNFVLQFYAKDSNIKSIKDLNGKRVNLSNAGSGTDTWGRRVFEQFGIKPAKISNVSPSDANDLMRDGMLDAAAVMGSIHPSIMEMAATTNLSIFGLSDADADALLSKWPDVNKVTMKADLYKGQTQPFTAMGEVSLLVCSKNLPDDLVYDITKASYEGMTEMAKSYIGFAAIDPKDIKVALIPLHPGAYKYFQEKGIQVPDTMKPLK